MQFTTITLTSLLGLASAQTVHVVSVSSTSDALEFSPDNIKVPEGDMIQFQFRGGNHSVVQSNFDNACQPISLHSTMTGIFSGFMPVSAGASKAQIPTYTVEVKNASAPMWIYCSQSKHCQAGMVMVVNQNTTANASRSLANYKKLAAAATANITPSNTTSSSSSSSSGASSSGAAGSSSSSTASGSAASSTTSSDASGLAVTSGLGLAAAAAALFML